VSKRVKEVPDIRNCRKDLVDLDVVYGSQDKANKFLFLYFHVLFTTYTK
jgi:hypothetical protein